MNPVATQPTILIVDDDVVLAHAFALALRSDGCDVKVTHTAEDALHEVETAPPDAIILDYRMPMINGVGFLYRLRQHTAHQHVPVMIVTGETAFADDVLDEIQQLGAQLQHKPLGLDTFLAATRSLLARRHAS